MTAATDSSAYGSPADDSAARLPLGPVFVGASLAIAVLGALALLRVVSPEADRWLTWRPAAEMVGPLAIGVAVWLTAWAGLTLVWRRAQVSRRVAVLCFVLIAIGLVLAFPPLDRLFG
jgi:hypothetical protein